MAPISAQRWYELVEKSKNYGLGKLSKEEQHQLLFNSYSKGHVSLDLIFEMLDIGCDRCGKVVMPEDEHTEEDCTVWRVMES
jgi:hypothetical protein